MEALKEFCRQRLLVSGFQEASKFKGNFYKPNAQYTAYFVNFKDRGGRLGICYGLASTAFTRMSGCENSLTDHGILNEDACIRYFIWNSRRTSSMQKRSFGGICCRWRGCQRMNY